MVKLEIDRLILEPPQVMMRMAHVRECNGDPFRMKNILITLLLIIAVGGLCGCGTLLDTRSHDDIAGESGMHEVYRRNGGEQSLETF